MSLALVGVRIFHNYSAKIHERFSDEWEPKLFDFMTSDTSPEEFLKSIEQRRIFNLLKLLRNYLNLLKGNDFNKLSSLILTDKINTYFSKSLRSIRIKKRIEVIYYLGIFKNNRYKKKVALFLKSTNDELYAQAALSLARINAEEYIDDILTMYGKHKRISSGTLYSVLIQFNKNSCNTIFQYLNHAKDDKIKSIILAALTHFKYQKAVDKGMHYLLYSHSRPLLVQSMKYFAAIEYAGAANALRLIFLKSSPELISQAIKTSVQIINPELETIIYQRVFDFNWQNKIDAVNALYEMNNHSRTKLVELSQNLDYPIEASIAKMVLSEREIIES